MVKRSESPDYELAEMAEVSGTEQFRAFGDDTRRKVLGLLSERAATTSQLAEAIGVPKGSLGHHLKVLEGAGLIQVVRTRRVRALTEKYYGRVARVFKFVDSEGALTAEPFAFFRRAMEEYAPPEPGEPPDIKAAIRHARIPRSRAREFAERMRELADEFAGQERVPGESVYGFVAGVYLTDWPELPEEGEQ
ncbi:MAG: helix-turn-helix domain-containing protein [Rubrobacter sp.]|nr:helix-turn-helix domain-containing protein [Rubrobacter sp.]